MMKGLFITFEGIDGCGKSTQIELFRKRLDESGFKYILIREPGGTAIGESIRTILLDKVNTGMKSETELLLFEASRAQNVREIILPALFEGKIVLCDRFADSSVAYQGFGRQLGSDTVNMLNNYATDNTSPDITFIFDIDPIRAAKQLSGRQSKRDRLDSEDIGFMSRAREGFLSIARVDPKRVKLINAGDNISAISDEVFRIFEEVVKNETGLCDC